MSELITDPSEELSEAARLVAQRLRRSPLAPIGVTLVALGLDLPLLAAALWFAQYAALADADFSVLRATIAAMLGALVVGGTLAVTKGYTPRRMRHAGRSIRRAAQAFAFPVLVLAAIAPGLGAPFLLAAAIAFLVACIPSRLAAAGWARWVLETGLLDRRAVIAGGGEHAERLIRGLAARPGTDIQIHGLFDSRDDVRSPPQVLGVPKLGDYDDLVRFVRASAIDMVIISLPLEAEERINWLLDAVRVLPVEVRLSAYSRSYAFAAPDRDPLISAIRRAFTPEVRVAKRVLDVTLASMLLVLLLPVMAAIALAVRLDSSGPVFFRQKRHGYNDRVVDVWKFRSLHHGDADPDARQIVTRGDKRVTRVGRILRRTSLDELPQLINVLRGELSLVGPRPHAVDAVSSGAERFTRLVDGYSARHRLPPGITGWAQVNGLRGAVDDPEKLRKRFEYDLYYIENWSIWLDIRILLKTPFSLVGGNAY